MSEKFQLCEAEKEGLRKIVQGEHSQSSYSEISEDSVHVIIPILINLIGISDQFEKAG